MKQRKTLVGILGMVLLLSSVTASAYLPPLNSRSGSGYYPSGVQTPSKYYTYFVGGTRQSGEVRLEYGNGNPVLSIEILEWSCYNPGTNSSFSGPLGFQHGNETVERSYTIPSGLIAQGAYINAIEASFKIGAFPIAVHVRSS